MFRIHYQALLLTLLIGISEAWFSTRKGTGWDKLSVTWGKFNGLPITTKDATKYGWHKINKCSAFSYFRGNRYMLGNDKSVMLLFDTDGKIAGIQFGIAKSLAQHAGYNKSYWNVDGDSLVVTAYFVHPKVICDGKRSKSPNLGENLYIQLGSRATNLMKVPLKEDNLISTKWVRGKCFYTMGQHYWYDISANMKCKDFFPVFLLYNGGILNGFGWAMQANVKSPRVEHPTPSKFHYFFEKKTQPLCMNKEGILTTEHVFLEKRPYLNFC